MKQEYTIVLSADNNFSVLNRIINVLNRRRVRIKKLMGFEDENDFRRGGVLLLIYSTEDTVERVRQQLEKLIEVDEVTVHLGSSVYFEQSEKVIDVD